MRVAYYGVNKLRNIIKAHKDPLPNLCKKNVVYKLNCNNCEATYVGQTKRQLKTRIVEHRNHIKRNTSIHSVITDHRIISEFDWDNVEILNVERNLNKRLISEMISIKSQRKSLNLQTDTDSLDRVTFRASWTFRIFNVYWAWYILHYSLSRPCQKKTVTYASHSAFDFLTTPTCCIWCVARLNWGLIRLLDNTWVVCITFNCLLNL